MLDPDDTRALVEAFGVDGARARQDEYIAACAAGNAEAERLCGMLPGPELAAALVNVGSMLMDDRGKVLIHASWERQKSWTEAQQMVVLRELTDPRRRDPRLAIPDLAVQSHVSERTISTRAGEVSHLAECLPRTWEALVTGRITKTHAWVLGNVTRHAPADVAEAVEAAVLEKAMAKGRTPGQLATAARTALLRIDPQGAAERAAVAKTDRTDVRFSPDEDEIAHVMATGDAWNGRLAMDEINRRADQMQRDGDDRPIGHRRYAAFLSALLGEQTLTPAAAGDGTPPMAAPAPRTVKRATALLLVNLSTLLAGSGPAQLAGYGPITAELAREIAKGDVSFRRLVFDPMTGLPVDVGDKAYELSEPMRRWIDARDRTCLFPGCSRHAWFCDADHGVEWPEGDTTCENCGLLCRGHHNLKTKKLWKLRRNADNSVDWTSPLGFDYHRDASTYDEFLDAPDPPEAAADDEDIGDDPDPPEVAEPILGWRMQLPPAQDEVDIDYDVMIADGQWRPITPRVAEALRQNGSVNPAA